MSSFKVCGLWSCRGDRLVDVSLVSFVCSMSIGLGELLGSSVRAGVWGYRLLLTIIFQKEEATPPLARVSIVGLGD
jgi:hypothetical protein